MKKDQFVHWHERFCIDCLNAKRYDGDYSDSPEAMSCRVQPISGGIDAKNTACALWKFRADWKDQCCETCRFSKQKHVKPYGDRIYCFYLPGAKYTEDKSEGCSKWELSPEIPVDDKRLVRDQSGKKEKAG